MSECADKFGVTDHDYRTALTSGNVDAIDPCFWSCCFKGTGVFNAEGLYDLEATLPFIKTTFHDDNYKQVQKIATLCEKGKRKLIID
ncbi:hypothetical protein HF086_015977 [Spodoptera exigua]|uniref:Uncharacterized protein n=1 Tax=Spodoptera exigua TaxID=7107 RepID=A0A922SDE4_SPOEX|nr:hypothetical protein HF086_015977 [Spodoptera exigua]